MNAYIILVSLLTHTYYEMPSTIGQRDVLTKKNNINNKSNEDNNNETHSLEQLSHDGQPNRRKSMPSYANVS
jgi:hypothetical protein